MTKLYMAIGCLGWMFISSVQSVSAQSNTQQSTNTQTQTEVQTKPVTVKSKTVAMDKENVTNQTSKNATVGTNQEDKSTTTLTTKTIVIDGVTKTVISKVMMNSQSERGRQHILDHPEKYYVEE